MHYMTLDYQTKMGVVYPTLVPSSGVPLPVGVAHPR